MEPHASDSKMLACANEDERAVWPLVIQHIRLMHTSRRRSGNRSSPFEFQGSAGSLGLVAVVEATINVGVHACVTEDRAADKRAGFYDVARNVRRCFMRQFDRHSSTLC